MRFRGGEVVFNRMKVGTKAANVAEVRMEPTFEKTHREIREGTKSSHEVGAKSKRSQL